MIRKAEHVAMIVTEMDRSIAFYQEMFGYQVRLRGQSPIREMTFLYHDNQPGFEIELIRDLTPMGDYSEQGLVNHLAFTVDDIDEAINHYREKGIEFKTETPNPSLDGGRTIFFYGPDRELLQFVEPGPDRRA
ncbi:VOC family protein [Brevibacillus choshinensis]|uniref:VOC family protein n=1 Tax=Brevibacillus choshinensis TaxID=54911 RepID=A0ABX7FM11_BRECH|nr:VOC family protein [Brevibacillus choshinensis]QRG67293.1 VOC family protein [Brevibacillus choshinensis]